MMKRYWHSTYAVLCLTLLAFSLRLFELGGQSMWWDEVYVVLIARRPFPDWLTWVFFEERSHPPGYFFFMSLWTAIGTGEFVVRYSSVIWGTLAVPLTYALGKRVGGRGVGLVSALLLALSPYHIWYSQEARMYAPQVCLALLSSLVFLRLLERVDRSSIVATVLVNAIGLYTFYLFPLILFAQLIYLIVIHRRSVQLAWLAANVVAGVLFLPWLVAVFATGGFARAAIQWIPAAKWYDPVISLYTEIVGTTNDPSNLLNWVSPLVLGTLAIYGLRSRKVRTARNGPGYLALWLVIPIGLVYLVSLPLASQQRSLYADRYFIPELPALLILVSSGTLMLLKRWPRASRLILALAALPPLISVWFMYYAPAYARDDWRDVGTFIASNADPAHDQIALEASLTWPYSYYDRAHLDRVPYYPDMALFTNQMNTSISGGSTRLWLLTATIPGSAHRFVPDLQTQLTTGRQDVFKRALDSRYEVQSEKIFQGVLVTSYRIQR